MKVMVVLALGLFVATSAAARLPHGPTDAEQALLPPFCAIKLKGDNVSALAQTYIRQFGRENWRHLHHYCYALNFKNRARVANDARERSFYHQKVIDDYEYVFRATEPRFWMRPQMYFELANFYLEIGRPEKALPLYEDAIRLNRSFVPAYLALINHHRRAGNRTVALDFATEGLRHAPSSDALRKAFLDNGGREPFPEPIAPERPRSTGQRATADEKPLAKDMASPSRAEVTMTPEASYGEGPEEAQNIDPQRERSCRFCPPDEIEQRWRETFE